MAMSPSIKKTSLGFSLIELLVATAILGSISLVGVQFLWDTLTTRSKQYSIEGSADNFRLLVSTLTKAIQSAKSVSVPESSKIEIKSNIEVTDEPCRTIRLNSTDGVIEQAIDDSLPTCTPPDDSQPFRPLTKEEINIQSLEFSPLGDSLQVVTIKIEGTYKDNLGEHPISFNTTVAPRTTL